MSLYIPVLKKMKYSEGIIVERFLPAKGDIIVKKGDKVVPFSKVGRAKISKERFQLAKNIHISKEKTKEGAFFYEGERLGRVGFKTQKAPYNGFISVEDSKYYFNQEKRDSWLLSGVWGIVENVLPNVSAQIKTQTIDINFVIYTKGTIMGELIVFPNPSELLDLEYLQNFSNSIQNKIIYIGHHIRKEVYDKAVELGVGGLIGGSIDLGLYQYAKSQPVGIAITTGFGKHSTPSYIFEFIKTISNRHVFLDGTKGVLQVPVPIDNKFTVDTANSTLREVKKGLSVVIFNKTQFGFTGEVEDVQEDIIYVRLNKSEEIVGIKIPNLFALA